MKAMQQTEASTDLLPCTRWFRLNVKKKEWEFNHLEDGHAKGEKPAAKFPSQSGWSNSTWAKSLSWLDRSIPPKVIYIKEV